MKMIWFNGQNIIKNYFYGIFLNVTKGLKSTTTAMKIVDNKLLRINLSRIVEIQTNVDLYNQAKNKINQN